MKKYLEKFIFSFLNISSIISAILIFKDIRKIIFSLMAITILSLIYVLIRLCIDKINDKTKYKQKIQKLKQINLELKKNNKALVNQYRLKKEKLEEMEEKMERMEWYWESLNIVFLNAIQGSKSDRFNQAYSLYQKYTIDFLNKNMEE